MKKDLLIVALCAVVLCGCKGDPTLSRDVKGYDDPLMQNEKKITAIIKNMTLEEKVAMLHGKHMFTHFFGEDGKAIR